jgi:hypothetical protein
MKSTVDHLQAGITEVQDKLKKYKETSAAGFDTVHSRIDHIQAHPGHSAEVKAGMKEVLPRAVMRLKQLYDAATQLEGTVIVGKLPSAPAERYSEDFVRNIVSQLSGSQTSITPTVTRVFLRSTSRRLPRTSRAFVQGPSWPGSPTSMPVA